MLHFKFTAENAEFAEKINFQKAYYQPFISIYTKDEKHRDHCHLYLPAMED
jgi:hypothetical protein